jgi:hypothetical protein
MKNVDGLERFPNEEHSGTNVRKRKRFLNGKFSCLRNDDGWCLCNSSCVPMLRVSWKKRFLNVIAFAITSSVGFDMVFK